MAGDEPYSLYAYDSYGNQTGNDYSNDSFSSYKGYDKGPFGYKTGVRQYDPETGRFLSPDAFKGYMDDPSSQHPYVYCQGNPVRYSDPTGYSAGVMVMEVGKAGIASSPMAGPAAPLVAGTAVVIVGLGYTINLYSTPEGMETLDIASKQIVVEQANIERYIHKLTKKDKAKGKRKNENKKTDKAKSSDKPSWVPADAIRPGESGKDAADRLCKEQYGEGNYSKGAGSEHSRIKKFFDRHIFIYIPKTN